MHRRRLLQMLAAGTGAIAGCTAGYQGSEQAGEQPPRVGDVELPVPAGELETRLPKDAIPAIDDPAFAEDWSGLDPEGVDDPTLPADAAVIGVERAGEARAYPLRILDWHEIVNDSLGGAIAVTYCVLCGSSVVVERLVDGEPTIFGVSGQLWRNDLVMYDRATDSRWSQILATAIRGPRTGDQLTIIPSTLTTWGEWREARPETQVLLPPPRSGTVGSRNRTYDYFSEKYDYGGESQLIGYDQRSGAGSGRTLVVGIEAGGETRAYPFHVVASEGPIEDTVGGMPVVVAVAPDDTLVAYDRRIDGRARSFSATDERHLSAAGSRWELTTGRAVDGPHEGTRLDRANEHPPMFWTGWSAFNPETSVYGDDLQEP
ncbi:DUF3179 domain-containing protein [Natronomonas sp.]|uniref:DUF3179 domain-containing protein n=1 Tax=Natronomonas sp. TaxID=2184060 RepID=UPI002FC2A2AF